MGQFGFGGRLFAFDVGFAAPALLDFVVLPAHKTTLLCFGHAIAWRRKMTGQRVWFNTFLLAWALAFSGCQSPDQPKAWAGLGLHLEVNPDGTDRNGPVAIGRSSPFMVNVDKRPFLTEQELKAAAVVPTDTGVAVKLEFDRRGTLLLDQYSSAYRGKRAAILARWDREVRWLAAPRMDQRITNGVLVFTPDASRAEAERLVLGLNKTVRRLKRNGP